MLEKIPLELLDENNKEEDVFIIIGENGCGKSTLLRYLANFYCDRRKIVVGIANTIHDKFDIRKSNFNSLKWSRGRRQTKEAIKKALVTISLRENEQGLKNAARALEYVGFDPTIGFSLNNFRLDFESRIMDSRLISEIDKDNLMGILSKLKYDRREPKITWFDIIDNSYYKNVASYSFTILFPYETILKKLRIIDGIDIYLSKDNQSIPLFFASSGELSLISSIIYISTVITPKNTVILIDEPENSLHPKWQKDYVKILLDIFYYYQPKIVIATHSPIILNGAEMSVNHPTIFKAYKFDFELQNSESKNIEEIFYDLFDVTTPENRFLSNLLVTYLNQLASRDIDIQSFQQRIEDIQNSTYDERQTELISKVLVIANDITKS